METLAAKCSFGLTEHFKIAHEDYAVAMEAVGFIMDCGIRGWDLDEECTQPHVYAALHKAVGR